MPRWPDDARERLIGAALELFAEQGYSSTTVQEVARSAGVTPRTFFRHFPDKEEVLFADDDRILPALLGLITAESTPVRAEILMSEVLSGLAEVLEPERERLLRRERIVAGHLALTGRELAKQGRWQEQISAALVLRGFTADLADLLAAMGFALFRQTLRAWLDDDDPTTLADRVRGALPRLRTVLDAESSGDPASVRRSGAVEPDSPPAT